MVEACLISGGWGKMGDGRKYLFRDPFLYLEWVV